MTISGVEDRVSAAPAGADGALRARALDGVTAGPAPTALWAVLAFTFVNSFATGAIFNGVSFLAKHAYGFDARLNFIHTLVLGVSYIAGAALAGKALRRLAARWPGVTPRRVLVVLMVVGCVFSLVPAVFDAAGLGRFAPWVFIALYSPFVGALWPIVEGYMSGGRSGENLRRAMGRFNVVWSGALVACMWAMAPLVESNPLAVITGVGFIHLVSAVLLVRFASAPGAHESHADEPHPASYVPLLRAHRVLLPMAYMVMYTLTPYLPRLLTELKVAAAWQTPVVSVWHGARVATFWIMERFHGWHGSWLAPIGGVAASIIGFGLAVVAPSLDESTPRLAVALGGLALFGVGVAVIYSGALYYAMEVGDSQVDAGGVHESLIGLGYTVGPALGLGALWAGSSGLVEAASTNALLFGVVAVVSVSAAGAAFWTAARSRGTRLRRFKQGGG